MRTSKPFSTISFNTYSFLWRKCVDLVNNYKIFSFIFIHHLPEEDENKEHYHLFLIPNGTLDTEKIREEFLELLPGEDKPLGVLPFRSSSFVDWYLYAIHDKDYLVSKCQSRKYHYSDEDLKYPDYDQFIQLKHSADFSKFKRMKRFREMAESGVPFQNLVAQGFVPVQQIFQYREMYNLIKSSFEIDYLHTSLTERNNRVPHADSFDGEIETIGDASDGDLPF